MGCTHRAGCPLFPILNASLQGWRDAYCDSDSGWRECARYRESCAGAPVPLSLLPNGKYAQAIAPADSRGAARVGGPSRFEPRRHAVALLGTDDQPVDVAQGGPDRPVDEPVAAAQAPRPGWWSRFVGWLRGPA